MALFPPLSATPEEVRALLAPLRHRFSIAVVAAGNAFAVGAIIRTAHSFLAKEILLIGEEPFYEKASMGMEKYEEVLVLEDEARFLSYVGSRPLFALEKDAAEASLHAVKEFPDDVVFLFGSERFGIPEPLAKRADRILAIPLYGVNHSLPLAIAAGIVMAEWARRHYAGGRVL